MAKRWSQWFMTWCMFTTVDTARRRFSRAFLNHCFQYSLEILRFLWLLWITNIFVLGIDMHFWIAVFNIHSRFWGFYDTSESQVFLFRVYNTCISESPFSIFPPESDAFVSHLNNCSALLFFVFFCTSE